MGGRIGVGMLGCGFIGMFHSHALRSLAHLRTRPAVEPDLIAVADISESAREVCSSRFGWAENGLDWRPIVADPRIGFFINSAPNDLHAEPSIEAARNGKHVFCEKPLGRTADEAFEMWRAVAETGVTHQCAFIFRFVPAIRFVREIIQSGELGEITHVRASFLMSTNLDPSQPMSWRMDKGVAGLGALGDLGAHMIDKARYTVGEIAEVSGLSKIAIPERDGQPIEVDDAFVAVIQFANGAIGTMEGSRIAAGYGTTGRFQVDGTKGSVRFELERLNEIEIADGLDSGFRTVRVIKSEHPFSDFWWEASMQGSHPIGWVDCFVHQMHHCLNAIADEGAVAPLAATFEDGYRAAEVCDAIARSWQSRRRENVTFRSLGG